MLDPQDQNYQKPKLPVWQLSANSNGAESASVYMDKEATF